MPTKNHFAVLGIDISAGENEVKKAYRTLAKQWHPDKNKDPGAKEKFQEIAASYEYLSSQDRRELLEREIRRASQPQTSTKTHASSFQTQNQTQKPPTNTTGPRPAQYGPSFTSYTQTSSSRPKSGKASTSKHKTSHWSDSFTKNYRSQQQTKPPKDTEKEASQQERSSKTNGDTSGPKRKPRIYTSSDEDEMFEELFGDFFATDFGGLSGARPKVSRPRNVAPETGAADGLDEEYLFSPRHDNENSNEQLPCPWCGKLFTRGKLGQHEEKCGKFGLSADEDEDEDANNDLYDSDDTDDFSYYSSYSNSSKPGYASLSRRPSWQRKQEETRNKIRQDKKKFKNRVASQGQRNPGYITCPYCQRDFSSDAASKHMPWCKEHTQKFGQPLNPKPERSRRTRADNFTDEGGGDAMHRAKRTFDEGRSRRRKHENEMFGASSDAFAQDPFAEYEGAHTRSGNDRPFPTHGPKLPDAFDLRGVKIGQKAKQPTSPRVTIGIGKGPRVYVGLSSDPPS